MIEKNYPPAGIHRERLVVKLFEKPWHLFLQIEPRLWEEDEDYRPVRDIIRSKSDE